MKRKEAERGLHTPIHRTTHTNHAGIKTPLTKKTSHKKLGDNYKKPLTVTRRKDTSIGRMEIREINLNGELGSREKKGSRREA